MINFVYSACSVEDLQPGDEQRFESVVAARVQELSEVEAALGAAGDATDLEAVERLLLKRQALTLVIKA